MGNNVFSDRSGTLIIEYALVSRHVPPKKPTAEAQHYFSCAQINFHLLRKKDKHFFIVIIF